MPTYLYENLDEHLFQQLVQALIVGSYPGARVYPTGQRDGGRDASLTGDTAVIFQVKFSRNPYKAPNAPKWVEQVVRPEVPKVQRLAEAGRLDRYVLVTNMPGTADLDRGTIDKSERLVTELTGVPSTVWWRDDLDRRIDGAKEVKWSYPAILSGADAIRGMLAETFVEDRTRRTAAFQAFMAKQYIDDVEVRFRQVDLHADLLALFIDVPASFVMSPGLTPDDAFDLMAWLATAEHQANADRGDRYTADERRAVLRDEFRRVRDRGVGAAFAFLNRLATTHYPRVVLEGAPGQGKSTLAQFLCQVHRMRLLGHAQDVERVAPAFRDAPLRLPIKVDLRDLSAWLHKRNPFSPDEPLPTTWHASIEAYVSALVTAKSGGAQFSVYDLQAAVAARPSLLVLDALDEVADLDERAQVVAAVSEGVARLEAVAKDLQVIVTSRPSAYPRSVGLAKSKFRYMRLMSVTRMQIGEYAERWIAANKVSEREADDVRTTLEDRLEEPHVEDLARNPMQLAILLALVRRHSVSLPDKRTDFYTRYVDLFFDREAEKHDHVREHRELLIDLHRYIAWVLHAGAESGRRDLSSGRIARAELESLIARYLEAEGRQPGLVGGLVSDMTDRIVAIVSRVEGTYEFEVQPLREYFAARFLYETAPSARPGDPPVASVPERFAAIANRGYWLNVARFMAGFFRKGELDYLVVALQDLVRSSDVPTSVFGRALGLCLISDWTFSQSVRATRAAVEAVVDDATYCATSVGTSSLTEIAEPEAKKAIGRAAMARIEAGGCCRSYAIDLSTLVGEYVDTTDVVEWWTRLFAQSLSDEVSRIRALDAGIFSRAIERMDDTTFASVRARLTFRDQVMVSLDARRTDWLHSAPDLIASAVAEIMSGRVPFASHGTPDPMVVLNFWVHYPPSRRYRFDFGTPPSESCILVHRLADWFRTIERANADDIGPEFVIDQVDRLHELTGDAVGLVSIAHGLSGWLDRDRLGSVPAVESLDDASASWLRRVVAARTRSTRVAWWRAQDAAVEDDAIWCYLIGAIASPSVLMAMRDRVAVRLARLDPAGYDFVRSACARADRRFLRSGRAADLVVRLIRETDSVRLQGLLVDRLDQFRAQVEFVGDTAIADEVVGHLRLTAARTRFVQTGRKVDLEALMQYHADSGRYYVSSGPVERSAWKAVLGNASRLPSDLVGTVMNSAMYAAAQDQQKPVADIAKRDGWFAGSQFG